MYLEPHCVFSGDLSAEGPVDVVVTPVVKQELPAFTLVSGQEDAVEVAKQLKAKLEHTYLLLGTFFYNTSSPASLNLCPNIQICGSYGQCRVGRIRAFVCSR